MVTIMSWEDVMRIACSSRCIGELGWAIAKQLGLTDYEIRQSNVDEKIGERLNRLLREIVKTRTNPQWVEFDIDGNVSVH